MQKLRIRNCHAPILFPQFMIQTFQKHTQMCVSTAQMHSTHSHLMKSIDFQEHTYLAQ